MNDTPKYLRMLRACRRLPVDTIPVWFMRQAGRYMPEYRALRKRYSILELIRNADFAAEITLQPIRAFDVDAAIIFADILPLLQGMGLDLEFSPGNGPIINQPIASFTDIEQLSSPEAEEFAQPTLQAITFVAQELTGKIPVIGFSGAPFTLASYAIEGGTSRHFIKVKGLMYENPTWWHLLMDKLENVIQSYLIAQINHGAQIIQLFDSWAGALSPHDYKMFALPSLQRIIRNIKKYAPNIPVIYFSTGTSGHGTLLRETGADVISIDWRQDLANTWSEIGASVAIQGNLDPRLICAPMAEMKRQASRIIQSVHSRPGYIFNVGHGISKDTPVDHVRALVDFVHQHHR